MKRIMFSIHVGDSVAHILRTRGLAKHLSDCGHQIAYCIPYKGVQFLEGYLEPKDIRVTDQHYSYSRLPELGNFEDTFFTHAYSEFKVYQQFKPDILIGDTGLLACSYSPDIPFIKILTRFYIELDNEYMLSPFTGVQRKILRMNVENIINATRRKLGLPENFVYSHFIKPPVILNGASYFVDDVKRQGYLYSGINMALRGRSLVRNPDSNVAFVSLGTGLAEHTSQTLSKLLELIESHFIKIYVCYGVKVDLNDLYQPKNAIFKRIYSQLPTNVGILICHGGYAMLHLGMEIRVPIIAIPLQLEQYSNSAKMETLGIGKNLATFDKDNFRGFYQRTIIDLEAIEDEITNIKEPAALPKLVDRFKSKPDLFYSQIDDLINKFT